MAYASQLGVLCMQGYMYESPFLVAIWLMLDALQWVGQQVALCSRSTGVAALLYPPYMKQCCML